MRAAAHIVIRNALNHPIRHGSERTSWPPVAVVSSREELDGQAIARVRSVRSLTELTVIAERSICNASMVTHDACAWTRCSHHDTVAGAGLAPRAGRQDVGRPEVPGDRSRATTSHDAGTRARVAGQRVRLQ